MIRIYIYRKSDGVYMQDHISNYSAVLHFDDDEMSFTLTPPPNSEQPWRWIDDKWITDETA